jgi:energy-coupling factor transporter ATP-binding protein EcfA2
MSLNSTTNGKTRFTKGNPCPVCGGSDDDRRGAGERCYGYMSGKWVYCTREDQAGKAPFSGNSNTYRHIAKGPCPCGKEHAPAEPTVNPRSALDHVYKYRDQEGKVIFEVVRRKNPKGFFQRRPNPRGGKPISNLNGITPVLYNLPGLKAADPAEPVWICEGEKDVDRLGSLDLVATTNPMGAGKWRDEYAEALRGRIVAILPDNDEAGRQHARQVARSLQGKAVSVKVVELPGLPDKGDVSDWLDAGGTVERLRELLRETSEWTPASDVAIVGPAASTNGHGRPPASTNGHTNGSVANLDYAELYRELTDADLGIIDAVHVVPAPVDWLWPYRIAAGEMSLLAGDGGIGKSSLLLAIAAIITRGGEWPDKSGRAPIGSVIIVSAEDSRETTLVPRLKALGADLTKIHFVTAKARMRRNPGEEATINIQKSLQDLEYWKEIIRRKKGVRMMIIDPIPSYLGRGINDAKNSELRSVLEPFLDEVTRPHGIALMANTHLNKNVDSSTPIYRITGNTAYGALPRNVAFVVRDHENRERRIYKQAKCNNAADDLPALAFKMVRAVITSSSGVEIQTAFPEFEPETIQVDLSDAMGKKPQRGPAPLKTMEVALCLLDYLRQEGRPVRLADVFAAIGATGKIGHLKQNDRGQLRWSSGSILYEAQRRVPSLPEPNIGWAIEAYDHPDGGQVWRAVREGSAPETSF